MDASVSSYSQSAPPSSTPCRISPVGSSKRKSKPVKRIVDVTIEEPCPTSASPTTAVVIMGTAADTTTTTELKGESREEDLQKVEEPVKPVMDQTEMLRKLTELLGGQLPMPTTAASLFPAGFPLFNGTGCTLDLSSLQQTNGDSATTNNNLATILGSVSFPALAINTTPTTLAGVLPTASLNSDRLGLRTSSLSSSSLANSKGPVKRKLFEQSSRDQMLRSMGSAMSKEERIDLDDLENFAQMFKKQRIKFGFTQGDVGVALGRRYGTDFSQTTISRFEALNLSFKNMCKLRPLLKEWLADAEAAIANGATLNDLLERPNGEKVVKSNSPVPAADPNSYGNEPMVKRRRKRTNLDVAQRTTLDAYFSMNPRPDHERMTEIANLLDLDRDVVRVWFCNRRQKMRKNDEPDQPEDPLLTSLRAIAQGDAASSPEVTAVSSEQPSPSS